jgi:hypothetical protein
MTLVFTLCSSNYLAHAKALGDSVLKHNPDFRFVIGLVDRVPKEVDASYWSRFDLLPVEELNISQFAEMLQKYTTVELNTAVKPFYAEHLFMRDPGTEAVIYLDPDIIVYDSFDRLLEKLRAHNIVVTPHSSSFDETATNVFYEIAMLGSGIYNLGFIGLARTDTTFTFLKWWKNRLGDYCYYRAGSGMFVDQIWLTLAPLYFAGIFVEKDPGYNMSYWNHFERQLSRANGRYMVNGKHNLVFHHFSSYNPDKPDVIANRVQALLPSFSERPDLKELYDDYRERLLSGQYNFVRSLKPQFGRQPTPRGAQMKKLTIDFARDFLNLLPNGVQTPIKKVAKLRRFLRRESSFTPAQEEPVWLLR